MSGLCAELELLTRWQKQLGLTGNFNPDRNYEVQACATRRVGRPETGTHTGTFGGVHIYSKMNYSFLQPVAPPVRGASAANQTDATERTGGRRGSIVSHAINLACQLYRVTRQEMMSKRRSDSAMAARCAFIFAMRQARFTLPNIGRYLDRDHSTVSHALSRFDECATNQDRLNAEQIFTLLTDGLGFDDQDFNKIISANILIARLLTGHARTTPTPMAEKLWRANLECVLCAILAHYDFSYHEIAQMRGVTADRVKARVQYINQVCSNLEIMSLKIKTITAVDEHRRWNETS